MLEIRTANSILDMKSDMNGAYKEASKPKGK